MYLFEFPLILNFGAHRATMAKREVVCVLLMLGVFPKDVAPTSVRTRPSVTAAVGDDARFSCSLAESKEVLQVTWQKLLPEGEKNVATCNKYFGPRVNPDFRDKVDIGGLGLWNSSLVIRAVTDEDEGCYRCLFNAYPSGALSARTCLQLHVRAPPGKVPEVQKLSRLPGQELREPGSNSTDESVVFDHGLTWIVALCVLLTVCVVAALIFLLFKLLNKKIRSTEESKTPHKPDQAHNGSLTPFIDRTTSEVKQRSSCKKTPGGGSKPSTAKCSRKLFDPS